MYLIIVVTYPSATESQVLMAKKATNKFHNYKKSLLKAESDAS